MSTWQREREKREKCCGINLVTQDFHTLLFLLPQHFRLHGFPLSCPVWVVLNFSPEFLSAFNFLLFLSHNLPPISALCSVNSSFPAFLFFRTSTFPAFLQEWKMGLFWWEKRSYSLIWTKNPGPTLSPPPAYGGAVSILLKSPDQSLAMCHGLIPLCAA